VETLLSYQRNSSITIATTRARGLLLLDNMFAVDEKIGVLWICFELVFRHSHGVQGRDIYFTYLDIWSKVKEKVKEKVDIMIHYLGRGQV
jgi:hypothetical protein